MEIEYSDSSAVAVYSRCHNINVTGIIILRYHPQAMPPPPQKKYVNIIV